MVSVEEKLVRLRLDNAEFLQKANESTGIFQKIKAAFGKTDAIAFKGATRSAQELGSAVNNVKMSSLQQAIDTVNSRFSTLGVMGAESLKRITNAAIDTGKAMVNNLAVAPAKQGFGEYELQMRSIQTMLNNVDGATLDDVTGSLNTLNKYADKTIYSFSDMTSAMSKFTLAGLGLEDSQNAIMGLSNLAADAGVDNARLAGAQYQISQALQSGEFRLMDWKSIENAGLGSKKFRKALIAEAKELGKTDIPESIEGFRESLKSGWLDNDVMMNVLKKFSTDEDMLDAATKVRTLTQLVDTLKESLGSGWMNTWENLFGDFEQATELFTGLNEDFFGPMVEGFNNWHNGLSKSFAELGGREALINSIKNSFKALGSVLGIVRIAFGKVFPPITGQRLADAARSLEQLTQKFILSGRNAAILGRIMEGVFSAFSIGKKVIGAIAESLGRIFTPNLIASVVKLGLVISNLVIGFDKSLDSSHGLMRGLKSLGDVMAVVGNALAIAIDFIANSLANSGTIIKNVSTLIRVTLVGAISFAVRLISALGKQLSNVFKNVNFDGFGDLVKMIGSNVVSSIKSKLYELVSVFERVKNNSREFVSGISDAFSSGASNVGSFVDGIRTRFSELIKFITNIGSKIAGAIKFVINAISNIPIGALLSGAVLGGLYLFGKNLKKIFGDIQEGVGSLVTIDAGPLIKTSVALISLAGALTVIGNLDGAQLSTALIGLGTSLFMITKATKAMGTGEGVKIFNLAASLMVLSSSLKKLSGIDTGSLAAATISLGTSLVVLASTMKMLDGVELDDNTPKALFKMGISLRLVTGAIKSLAKLPLGSLAASTIAVGATLAMLTFSVDKLGDVKPINKGVVGSLIALAAAVTMLTVPIKILGAIDLRTLAQGFAGTALTLGALVLAINLLKAETASMVGVGAGMMLMASAITMLVTPIALLGMLPFDTLRQGLASVAIGLALLAGAAALGAGAGPGALAFAGAIAILTASLYGLIPVIQLLGNLPWQPTAIGIGLLTAALAAIGLVMGGVGYFLGPGMLAFAGAIGILSVAALISAAAVGVFAKGLATLIGVCVAAAAASGVLKEGMSVLIDSVVASVPKLVNAVIRGIGETISYIILALPIMALEVIKGVLSLLRELEALIPEFVNVAVDIVVGLADGLTSNVGKIVDAAVELAVAFVSGFGQALADNSSGISIAVKNVLIGLVAVVGDLLGELFKEVSIFGMNIGDKIKEGVNSLKGHIQEIPPAVDKVANETNQAMAKVGREGGTAMAKNAESVKKAGANFGSAIDKIKSSLKGDINTNALDKLNNKMGVTSKTAKSSSKDIKAAFKEMFDFSGIDLGAFDFEQLMKDIGLSGVEGFNIGIEGFNPGDILEKVKSQLNPEELKSFMGDFAEKGFLPLEEYDIDLSGLGLDEEMYNNLVPGADSASKEAADKVTDNLESIIPEVDATAVDIINAFKDGLSQGEFEELGKSWGYDFSRGIYNENGWMTDAGVELVSRLETAIMESGKAEEIGEMFGIDMSGGLTHHGGQYVTEAGAELMRRLVAGMDESELMAFIAKLGVEVPETLQSNTPAMAEAGRAGIVAYNKAIAEGNTAEVAEQKKQEAIAAFGNGDASPQGTELNASFNRGVGSTSPATVIAGLMAAAVTAFGSVIHVLAAKLAGTAIGGAFVKGVESKGSASTSAGKTIAENVKTAASNVDLTATGASNGMEFVKGIAQRNSNASTAGTYIANQVKDAASKVDMTATGASNGMEFVRGVAQRNSNANSAGGSLGRSARSGAGSISLYGTGLSVGFGFAAGISASAWAVYSAAAAIAATARSVIRAALIIKSPSRALKEDGGYFTEGFALGISENIHMAADSAKELATTTVNSLNDTAGALMEKMEEDLSINPTITPILDDSKVKMDEYRANATLTTRGLVGSTYGAYSNYSSSKVDSYNNRNNTTVNNVSNERLFEGATFTVREEADIPKIANAVKAVINKDLELGDIFNKGKVVPI